MSHAENQDYYESSTQETLLEWKIQKEMKDSLRRQVSTDLICGQGGYGQPRKKTLYSGVLFRSHLEAIWAAFFDLTVYKWEYEPTWAENFFYGWMPDFAIWLSETDPEPIFCGIVPEDLRNFPYDFALKIELAKTRSFKNKSTKLKTVILGNKTPWLDLGNKNPWISYEFVFSLGWICTLRSNRSKKINEWTPWVVANSRAISRNWWIAQNHISLDPIGEGLTRICREVPDLLAHLIPSEAVQGFNRLNDIYTGKPSLKGFVHNSCSFEITHY